MSAERISLSGKVTKKIIALAPMCIHPGNKSIKRIVHDAMVEFEDGKVMSIPTVIYQADSPRDVVLAIKAQADGIAKAYEEFYEKHAE